MENQFIQNLCRRSFAILAFVLAAFGAPAMAQTYNTGDIAVINKIIDNNGLKWAKAPADGSSVPSDWAYDGKGASGTFQLKYGD